MSDTTAAVLFGGPMDGKQVTVDPTMPYLHIALPTGAAISSYRASERWFEPGPIVPKIATYGQGDDGRWRFLRVQP